MLNWIFRKRGALHEMHVRLNETFSKVRNDMNHVGRWINHFNAKHDDHDKMFKLLSRRLARVEAALEIMDNVPKALITEAKELEEELPSITELSQWESLTETLQKICWQLAAIQKELPDQWVSLKYLAQELYPDKDYNKVRSTLSQYISSLEEMGYVKRMRKGKQAYVYSTKKNPCLTQKKKLVQKAKSKK